MRAPSTIVLEEELVVTDLTVKRALAAGVAVAMTGGADYTAPQALADLLQGVRDGIRYRVRHDLSAKLVAVGWFGDQGAATGAALSALPGASTGPISDDLVRSARAFCHRVLPSPSP